MKKIYEYREGDRDPNAIKLSPHPNFENALVNLDYSAVHVPINVFEVINSQLVLKIFIRICFL